MAARAEEGDPPRRTPVKVEFTGRRYRSVQERNAAEQETAGHFALWVRRLRDVQDLNAGGVADDTGAGECNPGRQI